MDAQAVDRVLYQYPLDGVRGAYVAPGQDAARADGMHCQIRKINGRELVVIRFGDNDTAVFRPFGTPEELFAYLGEPPTDTKLASG